MRRCSILFALALSAALSLVVASGAGAVVVDTSQIGHATSVTYPADQSSYAGVALVPGTLEDATNPLATNSIPIVTTSASCTDPALSSDLVLNQFALCWHSGGTVLHQNETFTLTWDQHRDYWESTRNYVEQFLGDVASGSGTLTSPYAVATQYTDGSGHAANKSLYGGGCIDYGAAGGDSCKLGSTSGNGAGNDFPASGCPVSGASWLSPASSATNDVCLTDTQIRSELQSFVNQTSINTRHASGYTPLVVVLLPPGVETCLGAGGTLCSANSSAAVKYCSYHDELNGIPYVVQPWTAGTGCDEPDVPALSPPWTAQQLSTTAGMDLVSPLSQGQIAAIVNPDLNGWFANDNGAEINDNGSTPVSNTDPNDSDGCVPEPNGPDSVIVGTSLQNPYLLQHEYNNAGAIENDPFAPLCAPLVQLGPSYVVPSSVEPGDVVEFDGSTTISTLIVPKTGYSWNFGDGTTAVGPSVEHSYSKPGSYTVVLTTTDRGGNVQTLSQTITVLASLGGSSSGGATPGLRVKLQLLPQSLHHALKSGIALRVSSNRAADGIATVSIARSEARRAHIKGGGASVVIGRGTVSQIVDGTGQLSLKLSHRMVAKLRTLKHMTVTVRLVVYTAGGGYLATDVAGRY